MSSVFLVLVLVLALVLVLVLVLLPADTVSLRHSAMSDKHARTRTDALLTDAAGVRQVTGSQEQSFLSVLSN